MSQGLFLDAIDILTDVEEYPVCCVYLTFGENVLWSQLICYSCHCRHRTRQTCQRCLAFISRKNGI